MHNLFKSISLSLVGIGVVLAAGAANAAQNRGGYNIQNVNSTGRSGLAPTQRMPNMPTLPDNTGGTFAPSIPAAGSDNPGTGPIPGPNCPDGGVINSEYAVENCMNDVLACINNGALPGGLNDLFNEDLRNSIFNGMSLCYIQVEKCVSDVRKNCRNIYGSSSDVWWDFNSRKVQPEYYSFVLRKTGLTPNQAENTCLLLDRNTYGSSFAAVSNSNNVTAEYADKVGAYNSQVGNTLIKTNPQGVKVNTDGAVDANRGHYARWDATAGECLIRVAAYNKDSHIKNSWLFGALGDDRPAEIWKAAGETFSCNKDLFGFSLMNQTSTVAVVGIGGGTLVGAGVGAIAGHGKREFDCERESNRKKLLEQLRAAGLVGTINDYLPEDSSISITASDIKEQCPEIVKLYDLYQRASLVDTSCSDGSSSISQYGNTFYIDDFDKNEDGTVNFNYVYRDAEHKNKADLDAEWIRNLDRSMAEATLKNSSHNGITVVFKEKLQTGSGKICPTFPSLNKAYVAGSDIYECQSPQGNCVPGTEFRKQINDLTKVFDALPILTEGEKSNMLKSTLIGAGVGAGAGGLATAITSFVEKNNINCRVGDGLEKVSYGKSFSLGSLKDYYVKWNLHLPDTIMPTAQVADCTSWKSACGMLKDLNQCVNAQINYRPIGAGFTTLVNGACSISGSVCIENYPVAKSQGACQ
ncbi:MAG: hypothetical protein LBF28_00380 [Rickettsiales bacterium]|jgi:hypothetical protein|nr:hypothetical protein [Rickettsiales bacterium]